VTANANTETARQKAKALARWEGEGGSLGPPMMTLDDTDLRILARLGAALLVEWDVVSETAHSAIFERASTLHAERDAARIKGEIAHFLDQYKDQ
jgi:hypothetical protein